MAKPDPEVLKELQKLLPPELLQAVLAEFDISKPTAAKKRPGTKPDRAPRAGATSHWVKPGFIVRSLDPETGKCSSKKFPLNMFVRRENELARANAHAEDLKSKGRVFITIHEIKLSTTTSRPHRSIHLLRSID